MQIQKIQSSDNLSKPNFKARFIYDQSGNFRNLWETSSKSSEFNSMAKQFSEIKNGELEIKEIKHKIDGGLYKIFNYSTNKEKSFMIPSDRGAYDKVEYLMKLLFEDKDFFKKVKRYGSAPMKEHEAVPTFLKDQDGYFEQLFNYSEKSPKYADKVAKFIESTEKGSLEIYDMNKFTGGIHQIYDTFGHRTGSEQCREYDIINRETGTYQHFIVPEKVEYKLEYLLDQIMADSWIRKSYDQTEGFRNILGLK